MPGEAFPAGDPRNAVYFETIGQLEHQKQRNEALRTQAGTNAKANYEYQGNLLTGREPQSYKINQSRAIRGGLLQSGVNAGRRGTIATDYANKRFGLKMGYEQGESGRALAKQQEGETYNEARAKAGTRAQIEAQRYLEEHPVAAPAAPAAPTQLPGGGYVGQSQGAAEHPGQWIGNVRIGPKRPPWKGNVRVG